MGDTAHKKTKSDHNDGNTIDLAHDPDNGIDCHFFANLALLDYRVSYVIWNKQIYNVDTAEMGWRPYKGKNGHTHHIPVSIKAACVTLRRLGRGHQLNYERGTPTGL